MDFDDRRRLMRLRGDVEMAIESSRHGIGDGADDFEVETLEIYAVDAEGHPIALVVFDPDERAALSHDFVFHDHRRTGLGRVEGVDAYLP
jgi:hypothetical protein